MADENGELIVDIEWENLDVCREWKAHRVPEGHEIIGLQTNSTNDPSIITRLGFVLRKVAWKWEMQVNFWKWKNKLKEVLDTKSSQKSV